MTEITQYREKVFELSNDLATVCENIPEYRREKVIETSELIAEATADLLEALIGEDEVKDQHFGDNAVYYEDGAPERNALRAELRAKITKLRES